MSPLKCYTLLHVVLGMCNVLKPLILLHCYTCYTCYTSFNRLYAQVLFCRAKKIIKYTTPLSSELGVTRVTVHETIDFTAFSYVFDVAFHGVTLRVTDRFLPIFSLIGLYKRPYAMFLYFLRIFFGTNPSYASTYLSIQAYLLSA